jgi:uncharacterized membrane protein
MIPFFVLAGGFLLLRAIGAAGVDALDTWQAALRGGLALMFVLTGVTHFAGKGRAGMVAMVPPRLKNPALLVTVTGLLELAGAVGLLLPPLVPVAASGLALLMIAMFPANVSAARRGLPVTPLPIRTVLQVVYLGAAIAVALT